MLYFVDILFNVYYFSTHSQCFSFQVSSIFVGLWHIRIVDPRGTLWWQLGCHWQPLLQLVGVTELEHRDWAAMVRVSVPLLADWLCRAQQFQSPSWGMAREGGWPHTKSPPLQYQKHALFKGITWPTGVDLPTKHSPLGMEGERTDRDGQTYRSN